MDGTTLCDAATAYDRVASEYDEHYSDADPRIRSENEFVKGLLLRHTGGGRILDVGCGTGLVLDLSYIDTLDYVGIDASEFMLAVAAEKHPDHHFVPMDMEDEIDALSARTFNHVVSTFAFYYATDPEKLMRSLFRLLRPGGSLLLVVATRRRLRQSDYLCADVPRLALAPHKLRRLAAAAGFSFLKVTGFPGWGRVAPGLGRYFALEAVR